VTAVASVVLVMLLAVGCEREQRRFSEVAPSAGRPGTRQAQPVTGRHPYDDNAWALGEGKRLYQAYNCNGCHASGGGGMGPALMDAAWVYGGEPQNVYTSIVEGRPNGMPAFGDKIPDQQIWQLVAYVRSLSAQSRFDVRPGRDDHMRVKESELARRPERPR
jgi:cytochrome c oxidase cbb3-type subunit III